MTTQQGSCIIRHFSVYLLFHLCFFNSPYLILLYFSLHIHVRYLSPKKYKQRQNSTIWILLSTRLTHNLSYLPYLRQKIYISLSFASHWDILLDLGLQPLVNSQSGYISHHMNLLLKNLYWLWFRNWTHPPIPWSLITSHSLNYSYTVLSSLPCVS